MGAQTPKSTAAETVNDVKIETHRQQDRNLFCKKKGQNLLFYNFKQQLP